MHQFNSFTCNSPVQFALAEFITIKENYLELGAFLQKKRDYFQELMKQTKFKALPSHGSYFQLYSYASMADEPERDFALRLIKEAGVATIPVSAFYQRPVNNNVIRFCFVKSAATLQEAVERLLKFA